VKLTNAQLAAKLGMSAKQLLAAGGDFKNIVVSAPGAKSAAELNSILMLTARDLVDDRIAGLDAGADDYLAKPFDLKELRARLRALLRRSGAAVETLEFADIRLDPVACRASRDGRPLNLTKTELALLELFLRNPGRVLSHRSSWNRSGATTSARTPTRSGCTSVTCATSWRPTARRG